LHGIFLIKDIIEKYPDARQQIISCIVNNIDRLVESESGSLLVKVVIENNPSLREGIVEQISLLVVKFPYKWEVIKYFDKPEEEQIISCTKESYKEKKITKLPLSLYAYFFVKDFLMMNV